LNGGFLYIPALSWQLDRYINGQEFVQVNMPASAASNWWVSAPAEVPVSASMRYSRLAIPSSLLLPGSNVIAVQVRQADGGFDNLLFTAALVAGGVATPSYLQTPVAVDCVTPPESVPGAVMWSSLFPSLAVDASVVIRTGQRVVLDTPTVPRLTGITVQ
jgi:hypothetical protein